MKKTTTKHHCESCDTLTAWHITQMRCPAYPVMAVCSNCYDGAPDGGYQIGCGVNEEDAVHDYNLQFLCGYCEEAYVDPDSEINNACVPCGLREVERINQEGYEFWCDQKYDEMKEDGRGDV